MTTPNADLAAMIDRIISSLVWKSENPHADEYVVADTAALAAQIAEAVQGQVAETFQDGWDAHEAHLAMHCEPAKVNFPTMLRKMWSGGEVQSWLDKLPPMYTHPAAAPQPPAATSGEPDEHLLRERNSEIDYRGHSEIAAPPATTAIALFTGLMMRCAAPRAANSPAVTHDLYKTGDPDAPNCIKDGNGEVVLGLCKRCNRGEIELSEPCDPAAASEDDLAIDRFAAMMKAKMALKAKQGRGGWNDPAQCSVGYLSQLLHEHVAKGDPIDVANLAMMLQLRGSRVLTAAPTDEAKP